MRRVVLLLSEPAVVMLWTLRPACYSVDIHFTDSMLCSSLERFLSARCRLRGRTVANVRPLSVNEYKFCRQSTFHKTRVCMRQFAWLSPTNMILPALFSHCFNRSETTATAKPALKRTLKLSHVT